MLSSLAFTLALLVSVVGFHLSFAVKSAFLIPNFDSYSLNNCIHMSFPTGSHPIIAGPRIFFFFLVSHFFVFGLFMPYVYGCPSQSFFPCPSSRLVLLISILSPWNSFLICLPCAHGTCLYLVSTTQILEKAFLRVNPASPPRITTVTLFTSPALGLSFCQCHLCTPSLSIPYSCMDYNE